MKPQRHQTDLGLKKVKSVGFSDKDFIVEEKSDSPEKVKKVREKKMVQEKSEKEEDNSSDSVFDSDEDGDNTNTRLKRKDLERLNQKREMELYVGDPESVLNRKFSIKDKKFRSQTLKKKDKKQ